MVVLEDELSGVTFLALCLFFGVGVGVGIGVVGFSGVAKGVPRVWVWVVTYPQTLARSTHYCT